MQVLENVILEDFIQINNHEFYPLEKVPEVVVHTSLGNWTTLKKYV